ncbi:MAG: tyrosine-type recombinase/integrase [Paludibacteraceae bacterium]|nr:tyrosine-type recombinase/integrase [Paludibacteraceae bacterium]
MNDFLDYIAIERKYSPRTVEAYREDLKEFCAYLGVEAEDFNPCLPDENDVKGWVLAMMEEKGHSPRSVKRKMSALRSYYKYLLREKKVDKDITRKVILPKVKPSLPVFFKPHEMEQATQQMVYADDFESIRDSLVISMFYQTGMRLAEMTALTDNDIDLSEGQIRVFGKRRKERIIPIGDRLVAQIGAYIEAREKIQTEQPSEGIMDGHPFWVQRLRSGKIKPLARITIYNIVRARMGEVSTLKKHSPHVLRHTFATTLLDKGADIRSIQTLLGHASLNTTQVYTHTTFEQIQRVYRDAHPRVGGFSGQKMVKKDQK